MSSQEILLVSRLNSLIYMPLELKSRVRTSMYMLTLIDVLGICFDFFISRFHVRNMLNFVFEYPLLRALPYNLLGLAYLHICLD